MVSREWTRWGTETFAVEKIGKGQRLGGSGARKVGWYEIVAIHPVTLLVDTGTRDVEFGLALVTRRQGRSGLDGRERYGNGFIKHSVLHLRMQKDTLSRDSSHRHT